MFKALLLAAAAGTILTAATGLATAASIRAHLTSDQLATVCGSVPVGSQNTVALTLANGTVLTGTVQCEPGDVAGADDPANHDVNDVADDIDDNDGTPGTTASGTEGTDDQNSGSGSDSASGSGSGSGRGGSGGGDD